MNVGMLTRDNKYRTVQIKLFIDQVMVRSSHFITVVNFDAELVKSNGIIPCCW